MSIGISVIVFLQHRKMDAQRYILHTLGPFYLHGLTLFPVWISNQTPDNLWDEIIFPFLNFNRCTVEV